jgi:hypothetical protein
VADFETALSAGWASSCALICAVAHHQKFDIGMPHQRKRRARYDNRCTEIAAHGVKRDLNLLRHKRSGNLIAAALTKPAAS